MKIIKKVMVGCVSTFYDLNHKLHEAYAKKSLKKVIIWNHKSKKYTQKNGQKKKYKETNNDIQNTTNKYGAIGTPTKTEVNSDVPEWLGVSALLVTPVMWLLNDTNSIWYGYRFGHQWT